MPVTKAHLVIIALIVLFAISGSGVWAASRQTPQVTETLTAPVFAPPPQPGNGLDARVDKVVVRGDRLQLGIRVVVPLIDPRTGTTIRTQELVVPVSTTTASNLGDVIGSAVNNVAAAKLHYGRPKMEEFVIQTNDDQQIVSVLVGVNVELNMRHKGRAIAKTRVRLTVEGLDYTSLDSQVTPIDELIADIESQILAAFQ